MWKLPFKQLLYVDSGASRTRQDPASEAACPPPLARPRSCRGRLPGGFLCSVHPWRKQVLPAHQCTSLPCPAGLAGLCDRFSFLNPTLREDNQVFHSFFFFFLSVGLKEQLKFSRVFGVCGSWSGGRRPRCCFGAPAWSSGGSAAKAG